MTAQSDGNKSQSEELGALEYTLSPREQRVLAALITERTVDEAAAQAGVGVRTLYRWLAERPAFRDAYRAELRGVMAAVSGRLQGSALRALKAIEQVLDDKEARHADRLAAASKILDLSFRSYELGEVEQRLEALERAGSTSQPSAVRLLPADGRPREDASKPTEGEE